MQDFLPAQEPSGSVSANTPQRGDPELHCERAEDHSTAAAIGMFHSCTIANGARLTMM